MFAHKGIETSLKAEYKYYQELCDREGIITIPFIEHEMEIGKPVAFREHYRFVCRQLGYRIDFDGSYKRKVEGYCKFE